MPSTNKLPNTGLNQWLKTDKPVMEDFNRDNEIIDAMAGHLKKTPYIGPDQCWYVWDTDKGEYIKEAKAQGEPGPMGPQGIEGPKGETGEKGETGAGFHVLGIFDTLENLQTAHPTGNAGNAFAVGNAQNNSVYIWSVDDSAWKDIGMLQGPQGVQGAQGPEGPQGEQGLQGLQGPAGKDGLTVSVNGIQQQNGDIKISADDIPQTGTRKFVSAEEKAAIGEVVNKAGKSKIVDVVLTAADWVEDKENEQWTKTITAYHVTATSVNEIIPPQNVTNAQLRALQAANLQDGGQSAGTISLIAHGKKPDMDLPVRIIIRSDI